MSAIIAHFKQKRGDVRAQRKAIMEVLSENPSKVSVIAEKTELPKDKIVWNLLGLLRWGNVEIIGEEEHELVFAATEVQK